VRGRFEVTINKGCEVVEGAALVAGTSL
jgi:hypothetical protein